MKFCKIQNCVSSHFILFLKHRWLKQNNLSNSPSTSELWGFLIKLNLNSSDPAVLVLQNQNTNDEVLKNKLQSLLIFLISIVKTPLVPFFGCGLHSS